MHNTKDHTSQSTERVKQIFGRKPSYLQTDRALRQHIDAIVDQENKKLIKRFNRATITEAAKLSK